MLNENMIKQIKELSKKPPLYDKSGGNIWTEGYLDEQMLSSHLNPEFDGASRKAITIEKTIEFFHNNILKANSTILDLGCGPGLYAEELCKKGHKVTGIDFSQNTIDYANSSARKQGLRIEYKCDNFLNLKYIEKYDVVMQIYGELNTFSDDDRDSLLNVVNRSLKPNGLFVFDVTTPVLRKKCGIKKEWYVSDGGFWRKDTHIVFEEGFKYDDDIWLDQYIVVDSEKIQVYRNWFHDYRIENIKDIIENAGFRIVNAMGSLSGEELREDSDWIAVVAQKI